MSGGRDYRHLVTTHREEGQDKQLIRRLTGTSSKTYKPVDYEKLKALAAEKKFEGHRALLKVKKLQQVSKDSKEQNLLKQHKKVWQKDFIRLNNLRKRLSADVETFVHENTELDTACPTVYQDFEDYASTLLDELHSFKTDTVDPVWTLREDLQYWLATNHPNVRHGRGDIKAEHSQIQGAIDNVKEQQHKILGLLYNEQISLEQDLKSSELQNMFMSAEKAVHHGIPEEAFDLECPDLNLKASVLEEFILLDEKYAERLIECEEKHSHVLESDRGDWIEDNHWIFTVICEEYPFDLHNRRTLLFDRLTRHFPTLSRSQLVEHEQYCTDRKYYLDRRKAIIHDWARDRKELFLKAKATFAEVCITLELEEAKQQYILKQSELCEALYSKVKEWREQKLEQMLLEQQIEARQREKQEELCRQSEEKEHKKRDEEKIKIKFFHQKQEEETAVREEQDRIRLEQIKQQMAKQAVFDKERVEFREKQLLYKMIEVDEKQKAKEQAEVEKEERLENLRLQVRPIVVVDPERVWKDTESWHNRLAGDPDALDIDLQKPLFQVNTYTSEKVRSDGRVRLEQQLRDMGLHNTSYGRHVMSQMKPPTQPRRDMESTVFKFDTQQ